MRKIEKWGNTIMWLANVVVEVILGILSVAIINLLLTMWFQIFAIWELLIFLAISANTIVVCIMLIQRKENDVGLREKTVRRITVFALIEPIIGSVAQVIAIFIPNTGFRHVVLALILILSIAEVCFDAALAVCNMVYENYIERFDAAEEAMEEEENL